MALSKSVAAVDEWAEIAQNAVREGATVDVSGCYNAALHINVAISSTTAHTGTKVEVQVSSNSSGDEDWHELVSFLTSVGTANSEVPSDNIDATDTTITVASTTGYDADETRMIFIEDTTVADSEICLLVSHVADTSITVQDGVTNAHIAATTVMYNIVDTYVIELPFSANRVRVIYDNTFDSNGATVHTYSRITKVTGI